MKEPIHVSEDTFDKAVINSDLPVLVDFWAPWCGPCQMIAPVLDEIAAEREGKLVVAKVNVDDNQSLAARYGITGIPALLFFKGGEVRERIAGVTGKAVLLQKADALA